MSGIPVVLGDGRANKELPERVRRELRTGETVYHSLAPCHVSAKFPQGKWVGQVRREERGRLIKYPVKAFGTPQEALAFVKGLRPDGKGRVFSPTAGEATVSDLYEYARKHSWKNLSAKRRDMKESRWRLHIEPYWGEVPLSLVTRRSVQEWITEVEEKIQAGRAGSLGLAQFSQCRLDLHSFFEVIGLFDERFEDRRNPFRAQGLAYTACDQRPRVCLESQHFPAIELACRRLVEEGLVTDWVVAMFMVSVLSGLRLGETLALCRDQIDFKTGAILVDRAVRERAREVDRETMAPIGDIRRMAINLPKGNKIRTVPMSDQLAGILKPFANRACANASGWELLFPSESGSLKEETRVKTAFATLCKRMEELANDKGRGGRGWQQNPLLSEFASRELPKVWSRIVYRDTRNSFASYAEEVGIPQATREAILGHGAKGVTNKAYTDVTSKGFQDARRRLTRGWNPL